MRQIQAFRTIAAPAQRVFQSVADIREYSKVQPAIVKVEFLTPSQSGVGTRFRETRRMGSRDVATELEVTEHQPPERVRFVSNSGGATWDTLFTVQSGDTPSSSRLNMTMIAKPNNLLARIMLPLIFGMVRKAVEADLDQVKSACEQLARNEKGHA
jgi:uncharacterized protein YndB with AHSA1/START domain